MAISNGLVHDNLVALTGRMIGGVTDGRVKDNLTGISELAGNEGEAAVADLVQTLNFTTWISDICDGYKQERELERNSDGYNETARRIREDIQNVNNLGHQMGIEGDIIPTPKNGQEVEAAAYAVYQNFALPYEAGAKFDAARYMQLQEGSGQISRAMKRLSASVAQNPQHGRYAKAYWEAQVGAAKNYNALAGEYLDSMAALDKVYTPQLEEMKSFLSEQEKLSAGGMSNTHMGAFARADKIDFESDDAGLQANLRETIVKVEKLIKTERKMLNAGHIDSERRELFEAVLQGYMKEFKKEKRAIEADNLADMKATAELEQQREIDPSGVSREHEALYQAMCEKQRNMSPTLSMETVQQCAKVASLAMGGMNAALIATGVTPISLNAQGLWPMVSLAKFAHDMGQFIKQEEAPSISPAQLNKSAEVDMQPEYKGSTKEKTVEKTPETNIPFVSSIALAIKNAANNFAQRMRQGIQEGMLDEDEQTENFKEQIEHVIGEIVENDGNTNNQSTALIRLSDSMKIGTGTDVFGKDPQDMTDEELGVTTTAVACVMKPMKDEEGHYLANFSDCYAVGIPEMTEPQTEYTSAITDLMIIGQEDAALAVRDSQTQIIDAGNRYQALENDTDAANIAEAGSEYEKINKQADEADAKMRNIMDVYKPAFVKAGLIGATAAYQKHEFNKAWKESIRERNVQLMCQGTLTYMEESKRETERIMDQGLRRPGGLLYG